MSRFARRVSRFAGEPVRRFLPQAFGVFLVVVSCSAARAERVHHDLSVRVEAEAGEMRGIDRIRLRPPRSISFTLVKGLLLDQLTVNGRAVTVDRSAGRWGIGGGGGDEQTIVVEYSGKPDQAASVLVIGASEVILSGRGWYPAFGEALLSYRLTIEVPPHLTAVAPGRMIEESRTEKGYRAVFESEAPADDVAVFAAPFEVGEHKHGKHALRTYFHSEVADLADLYSRKTASYLDLYESSIGEYPFSGFAIVSTTLPVGLGFPGLTLIGTRVLRLPFLPDTSLGHEVLHSWWGNGVLIDPAAGNWAEGLTTFMADYAYAERESAAKAQEMRLRWLRDYAVLPAAEDRPLTSFRGRSHAASQVVGYHKAAALFVMLRDLIGADAFDAGIRLFWSEHRFATATWNDLKVAFEKASRRSLNVFFRQWLERSGAPRIELRGAEVREAGGMFQVSFSLAQPAPPYELDVPVEIDLASETITRSVSLATEKNDYVIEVDQRPREVRVDPRHRLFRRLDPAAVPPILRSVAFDTTSAVVIVAPDDESRAAAREVADAFFEHPARLGDSEPLPATPCLIVGTHDLVRALLARNGLAVPASLDGKGTVRAWAAKRPGGGPIVLVSGADANALRAVIRPLPHYGSQSFLVFDGSRAIERGAWPVEEESLRVRFARAAKKE